MKNARTIVIALLATSFVAAGCGSSNSSSTSTPAASTPSTASTADTTASTPAETTPVGTTDTGTATTDVPATADAAVKAGIASCKQAVSAQAATAPDLVGDLNKLCEKITDAAGAKAAVKEICTKIVEKNVPSGAAREQALAACKAS
ncbi:MAG: hypothetical protein JWM31_2824 [Solirubrobacterales bacterium]|nr:hypothetical protein [Solirubrobacterales bacterium]